MSEFFSEITDIREPKPPRFEDFGLSAEDAANCPTPIGEKVSISMHSYASVAIAAGIGLWSFWGFFDRLESVLKGIFFGVLIAFVVFLLSCFLGSMFLDMVIRGISMLHRLMIFLSGPRARRQLRYIDALKKYERDRLKYQLWLHNRRQ